ncbi:uncharacterized protein LOC143227427 [Tachypleus tridentatus]|uniref:uncharacterized protein LOC143227427 n=1 Tax=Tachypleus tridentatus TaxID=6853 RepID=UPI003FCF2C46
MVKQERSQFSTRSCRPFDVGLSMVKRGTQVKDDHSILDPSFCAHSKLNLGQDRESDDSLNWEDFFGTTVEISSALMDMYDSLIGKDETRSPENEEEQKRVWTDKEALDSLGADGSANNSSYEVSPGDSNKSFRNEQLSGGLPANSSRARNFFSRRSFSVTDAYHTTGKKRPLSTSSVSSSSSSSSSSLPRNGMDVKKSYLASIESLDDDDDDVSEFRNERSNVHSNLNQLPHSGDRRSVGSISECGGSEANSTVTSPSRHTSYDPNLGPIDRVILEIVETERTYVRDLNEIIKGYLHHIQQSGDMKVSEQNLKELFGNIEDIYRFNSTFLEELEECGLDPVAVARCFVKNSTGFVIYTHYCTNYPRSVSVIKELMNTLETAEVFKERQLALHHCLPLGSYLLKPVQRILKYHLLLNNIVKHSDKESDGYPDIKNALSVMTGIAYHINDMKKKHEHAVRVQEIQSLLYSWEGQDLTTYGELMAEGTFRMFGAKALRHLFLFNKMLLIAKKKEEGILLYKTHIMCSNLMLIESIQGEPLCFHVIPFDNPRLQYTFQARNLEQKREWCLELKRVILENYNAVIPSHARQLVMELGQNKQENPVPMDKSSTKKQLSAPEYLEKRKQERRKSEINLNRAFKLRKGIKKVSADLYIFKTLINYLCIFLYHQEISCNYFYCIIELSVGTLKNDTVMGSKISTPETRRGRRLRSASQDITSFYKSKDIKNCDDSNQSNLDSPTTSSGRKEKGGIKHHFQSAKSPRVQESRCSTSSKESLSQVPARGSIHRARPSWRTWNSLPEETTDTEVEDNYETLDFSRLLQVRPPPRTARTQEEMLEDLAGEYVTFVFAHAYACRDLGSLTEPEEPRATITVPPVKNNNSVVSSVPFMVNASNVVGETLTNVDVKYLKDNLSESENLNNNPQCQINNILENRKSPNCDSLLTFWDKLSRVQGKHPSCNIDTSSTSSESSWKNNTTIRRVQSFTGIAKAKVVSLQHSFSFRQPSKTTRSTFTHNAEHSKLPEKLKLSTVPPATFRDDLSPTAPAVWLTQQQKHLADVYSKFGSLPRSFQLAHEYNSASPTSKETESTEGQRARRRVTEGNRTQYADHRPFTIASDKPCQVDLREDLDGYMEDSSHIENFSNLTSGDEMVTKDATVTSATTPAVSIENVSIHPSHKLYGQPGTRYAILRNVLTNVSSKIAALKLALGSPSHDQSDTSSVVSEGSDPQHRFKHGFLQRRSASRSSIKSDKDISSRAISANFLHSLSKAYSALKKHRLKRELVPKGFEDGKWPAEKKIPPSIAVGSSAVGARIARLHESEYSVPNTLMICRQLRAAKEVELRPDSLFSDSSNTTSSSDGGVGGSVVTGVSYSENLQPVKRVMENNEDDSPSDSSEDSVDSFYERTFEAIENSLADEMFRDSAIYSDPEEADLSTLESCSPVKKETKQTTLNKRKPLNCKLTYFNSDLNISSQNIDFHISRPVKGAIVQRLKILEENLKFRTEGYNGHSAESMSNHREPSVNCNSRDVHEESETSSEHSTSTVNTVMETCHASSVEDFPQPRQVKGWVKHIVDKLQAESNV